MWSGLCIFSRLSEKKQAGLCFESLQTCLGDNNSPDDACLASARLILPQLTQLLVILITTISSSALPPPRHIFRCLALTCCQRDLYSLFMCVYVNTCGRRGERKNGDENLISASWVSLPLFLSAGWLKLFEWCLFCWGYWYAAGRRRSINWRHVCWPTVQGHSPAECSREGKKKKISVITLHPNHIDNYLFFFFPAEKGRKLNNGLAYMWMFFHTKAKLSCNNLFLIVSLLLHIKYFFYY